MTFVIDLYKEHFDEAAFLYGQRTTLFGDAEVKWPDIGDFEERMDAHIQSLVDGGEPALQVCRERIASGEPDDMHAAARVLCRRRRLDLVHELLENVNTTNAECVKSVTHALKHEWPEEWNGRIPELWSQLPEPSLAMLPAVIGFKRMALMDKVLIGALAGSPDHHLSKLIWSLGRVKARAAVPMIAGYMTHADPTISAAAVLALLRIGESPLPAMDGGSIDFRYLLHACLAGTSQSATHLLNRLDDSEGTGDIAFALGVIGDIRAVEPLMRLLEDEAAGESAALALDVITGADLLEEVFVPDEIDLDELLDDELEKVKNKEAMYPPGMAPGMTVVRVSQDPAAWRAWWQSRRSRFTRDIRYRNGHPFTPECLLENLRHDRSPGVVRQMAYEELVVRYDIDVAFETDMTVNDQWNAIDKMAAMVAAGKHQWEAGRWYVSGRA